MTLASRGGAILPASKGRKAMKQMPGTLPSVLLAAIAVTSGAPSAMAAAPSELMTKGKLAADLGDQLGAEQAFSKLAADAATPESARAEALVRLAVVQRALGKAQASAGTFQKAMQSPGRDAQVTRLMTLALAGVVPDRARWASEWPKLRLATRSGSPAPHPFIVWPGPRPEGVREKIPARDPVTFDLEDVSLASFLFSMITGGEPHARWKSSASFAAATPGVRKLARLVRVPEGHAGPRRRHPRRGPGSSDDTDLEHGVERAVRERAGQPRPWDRPR